MFNKEKIKKNNLIIMMFIDICILQFNLVFKKKIHIIYCILQLLEAGMFLAINFITVIIVQVLFCYIFQVY